MPLSADDLLVESRATLRRVNPNEAASLVRDGALLIDIRPQHQRAMEGEIPGSIFIERNNLEYRFDLSAEWHIPEIREYSQHVIVLCSAGYASSYAAAVLQRMGFTNATDLDGGFQAWRDAGLPAQLGGTVPRP
jgi:rhodanese-related sulfurtransferase